jgi:hypothetical protein
MNSSQISTDSVKIIPSKRKYTQGLKSENRYLDHAVSFTPPIKRVSSDAMKSKL